MKRLVLSLTLLAALGLACGAAPEQTIPVEVTREKEVTREVEIEVEVTREIQVPVEVPVTREVEVQVEVTRVREVPVTVEITVEAPIGFSDIEPPESLCEDYPFMVALLTLEMRFWKAKGDFASDKTAQQAHWERADELVTSRVNVSRRAHDICAGSLARSPSQLAPSPTYSMRSMEGYSACIKSLYFAMTFGPPTTLSWRGVPLGERSGVSEFVQGIRDYCFEGNPDQLVSLFSSVAPTLVETLE